MSSSWVPQYVINAYNRVNGLPRVALFALLAVSNYVQFPYSSSPSNMPTHFDYIVVGGGVAGCVVASRLTEDRDVTVLLLEAGGEGNVLTRLPIGYFYLQDSVYDWKYRSVPQDNAAQYLNNRQVKLPAGKVLGGGSMLNAILWVRGTRADYQRWSDIGIKGWSYEENLPYYIRSENVQISKFKTKSRTRGTEGPIVVAYNSFQSEAAQELINAGGELGYRTDYDYNDGHRLGFSRAQNDLHLGLRYDSARGYIDPIRKSRSNLYVVTHAMATRVLFKGKTATGVEYERHDRTYTVHANKEVIISAGGVGSPKLLLLSGVGPGKHLRQMGIKQIHELPVGKNLQDHIGTVTTTWSLNKRNQLADYFRGFMPNNVSHNSPFAGFSNLIDWTGFINTKAGPNDPHDKPDIQFMGAELGPQSDGSWFWRDFNIRQDVWDKTYSQSYFKTTSSALLLTILLDYKTTGEVRLRSTDPYENPIIDIQYLSHPHDRETLLRGVKFARKMFNTDAMSKFDPEFMNVPASNCSFPNDPDNDGYLYCLAAGIPTTIYHYSSTMRMGADNDTAAVVDNKLRMRGLKRIRVVDTSVLPFLGSGNPQATNYMVAEKAADIIKGEELLPPIKSRG